MSEQSETERLVFVVYKHQATTLHDDFHLEIGGVMRTSAIPKGPTLDPQLKRLAMPTTDHALEYRTLKAGAEVGQEGAGPVRVWDEVTYTPERERAKGVLEAANERAEAEALIQQELAAGNLKFRLYGHKLQGSFALIRARGFGRKESWLLSIGQCGNEPCPGASHRCRKLPSRASGPAPGATPGRPGNNHTASFIRPSREEWQHLLETRDHTPCSGEQHLSNEISTGLFSYPISGRRYTSQWNDAQAAPVLLVKKSSRRLSRPAGIPHREDPGVSGTSTKQERAGGLVSTSRWHGTAANELGARTSLRAWPGGETTAFPWNKG